MSFSFSQKGYDLLQAGTLLFAEVEHNGIRIDEQRLKNNMQDVADRIKKLEKELRDDPIYAKWRFKYGSKTNLGADQQLAQVLFKELGYQHQGFSEKATDRFLSDESSLKSTNLPFVNKYIEWKKLNKLHTTYMTGVLREVCDGYLHPMFGLNIARTYRSMSEKINFQNIPIRDPVIGKMIRECFVPRAEDRCIVESDFSGIEVRIAYCYHKDPVMREYLLDPTKDMHKDMAVQCYMLEKHVNNEAYWKDKTQGMGKTVRYCGKNMYVFPEFYGDSYVNCSRSMWEAIETQNLKTPDGRSMLEHLRKKGIKEMGACEHKDRNPKTGTFEAHIKNVEHDFWNRRFRVYNQWKNNWWDSYQKTCTFTTHTGFHYYGTITKNQCVNWPVQGSAFHCLLWSMIELQKEIESRGMKTLLIGQIHDSILADVPEKELKLYTKLVHEITTKRLLKHWKWVIIPMEIEIEYSKPGASWYDKQPYTIAG